MTIFGNKDRISCRGVKSGGGSLCEYVRSKGLVERLGKNSVGFGYIVSSVGFVSASAIAVGPDKKPELLLTG